MVDKKHPTVPRTVVGKMFAAYAQGDYGSADRWRAKMNADRRAQDLLYPLAYEVFRAAVDLRFDRDEDVRNITRLLLRPRVWLWPHQPPNPIDAEALIRSALGEKGLISGLSTGTVTVIWTQVFVCLVQELNMSDADIHKLIGDAEDWVLAHK